MPVFNPEESQSTQDITDRSARLLGHVTVDNPTATVSVSNFPASANDPSTGTLQTSGNSTLSSILTKLIATPATKTKQDVGNTALASIDAGIPAALGQTTMAASMPVTIASNQSPISVVNTPPNPTGTHGNAWLATAVVLNGLSAIIDTGGKANITVFGNVSLALTLTVQISADGTNFYNNSTYAVALGNFSVSLTNGARYIRLQSSLAATITATISAK